MLINFLITIPIVMIWICLALWKKTQFPFWVWIINGIISSMAADGFISAFLK